MTSSHKVFVVLCSLLVWLGLGCGDDGSGSATQDNDAGGFATGGVSSQGDGGSTGELDSTGGTGMTGTGPFDYYCDCGCTTIEVDEDVDAGVFSCAIDTGDTPSLDLAVEVMVRLGGAFIPHVPTEQDCNGATDAWYIDDSSVRGRTFVFCPDACERVRGGEVAIIAAACGHPFE